MFHRRTIFAALAGSVAFASALPTIAQEFPNRPVTMVVPFPAGGITDAVARALANKMGDQLGKPVVVDNRPGGGGQIASSRPTATPCSWARPKCSPSIPRCSAGSRMTRSRTSRPSPR